MAYSAKQPTEMLKMEHLQLVLDLLVTAADHEKLETTQYGLLGSATRILETDSGSRIAVTTHNLTRVYLPALKLVGVISDVFVDWSPGRSSRAIECTIIRHRISRETYEARIDLNDLPQRLRDLHAHLGALSIRFGLMDP